MNWRAIRDPSGWYASTALAVLAAALRLPNLGWPKAFVFDETYYAKDAFSLLTFGYERAYVNGANERILAGDVDVFTASPAFVVHPPLGKWFIAAGEALLGMNPLGWRISAAIVGIVMVVLVHRITLQLFMNAWTAIAAGLFMAIDGLAISLSRTALLDQFLAFWILLTLYALIRDRQYYRRTLQLTAYERAFPLTRHLRPWRLVAMLCMTAAMATKWSALWFGFGFGLLALLWDQLERRSHPSVDPRSWLKDLGWLGVAVVIGGIGYTASWVGWYLSDDAYGRRALEFALPSLIRYHQAMLNFHTSLNSDHPYAATPILWPLQIRPTSFWYESYSQGQFGCDAMNCAAEVHSLGNPLLWWLSSVALVGFIIALLMRRSRRISWNALAAPLVGIASGWLPWLYFHERTVFNFYAIVFAPFMFMTLAYGLTLLATREVIHDAEEFAIARQELHPIRIYFVGAAVVLLVAMTAVFYPIWVGEVIPYEHWRRLMWFPSWI